LEDLVTLGEFVTIGNPYGEFKKSSTSWVMVARPRKYLRPRFTKLGKIQAVEAALVLVILALVSRFLPVAEGYEFFVSGVWGVVLYIVMDGFSELLGA
jgi:hypothetical protein